VLQISSTLKSGYQCSALPSASYQFLYLCTKRLDFAVDITSVSPTSVALNPNANGGNNLGGALPLVLTKIMNTGSQMCFPYGTTEIKKSENDIRKGET
jgi:hypothetical protein